MRLKRVENKVEQILRDNPKTRDDDHELIAEYYNREHPEVLNMPFRYVFLGHNTLQLTSFKSIERARRKVQARFPELASKKTKLKREKLEQEYKNYYVNWEEEND